MALAAALGEYGACVVVGKDTEAQDVIHKLKAQDQGRVLLAALERVHTGYLVDSARNEALSPLRDMVQVQDQTCGALVDLVLHNVYYTESLLDAGKLRQNNPDQPVRFVTATGEWLDERGFMHAGGRGSAVVSTHLSRRETVVQIQAECVALDSRIAALEDTLKSLKEMQAGIELELVAAPVRVAKGARRKARQQVGRLRHEHTVIGHRLQKLRNRFDQVIGRVGIARGCAARSGRTIDP